MPLLVAAADETGRTITMLSAGLVAVAFGLAVLTIWYWRFTSPRRRISASPTGGETRTVADDQARAGSTSPRTEETAAVPVVVEPDAAVEAMPAFAYDPEPGPGFGAEPTTEPVTEPVPVIEVASPPNDGGASIGLDSDEWALLTRAVMDEYLDS